MQPKVAHYYTSKTPEGRRATEGCDRGVTEVREVRWPVGYDVGLEGGCMLVRILPCGSPLREPLKGAFLDQLLERDTA